MRERFDDGSQVYPTKEGQSVPGQDVPTQGDPGLEASNQAVPKSAVPKREESGRVVGLELSDRAEAPDRDVDLATLRARLRALIREKLFASPMMQKMYADLVIASAPESEEAKLLAQNYQKIIDRITMANSKSCTHIKVNGVRCESPALRGEQFCYFHQHAYRGVRRPARSRLHPIALIESEEAIQASLMEVINGLLRNTLDVKRAELILRALHIAVKNARRTKFEAFNPVREIPEYAAPSPKALPDAENGVSMPEPELDMPYTAAIPLQLSREERAEREHQAKVELERARHATIRAELERAGRGIANGNFSPISHPQAAPSQRMPQPS